MTTLTKTSKALGGFFGAFVLPDCMTAGVGVFYKYKGGRLMIQIDHKRGHQPLDVKTITKEKK